MSISVQWVVGLAAVVIVVWTGTAIAESAVVIGSIKNVKGAVEISRETGSVTAVKGLSLLENDVIITGKMASVGMIFKDNSVLSIGPDSRVEIKDFTFEPANEKLSFVASILRGTMTYLSGIIARLQPDAVELRTPTATIGIRGTHIAIQVQEG